MIPPTDNFDPETGSMSSGVEKKRKALRAALSKTANGSPTELPDDTLILAPPIVYGFSLADKLWREHLCSQADSH